MTLNGASEDVPRSMTQVVVDVSKKKETCCPCSFMLAYRITTSLLQQYAKRYRSRRGDSRSESARYVSHFSYSLENPTLNCDSRLTHASL